MMKELCYDEKWHQLLRRGRLLGFLPFIELVFVSGSLALGGVSADSDFDVLVITKQKRLYTARFFCLAIFGLLGWRNNIKKRRSGFCFNHFKALSNLCLRPPYNEYNRSLYKNLIPVLGKRETAVRFYQANKSWLCYEIRAAGGDLRDFYLVKYYLAASLEKLLGGFWGDFLENFVKKWQLKKIGDNFHIYKNKNSRINISDGEVELCFNPQSVIT